MLKDGDFGLILNMSLFIASINSGSNGNCYYVGNSQEAVLVDAGISCRETEKRMKRMGLAIEKVKAIFVSHEHGDHISGIPALSKKYRLPVYITQTTFANSAIPIEPSLVHDFTAAKDIPIGNLRITPFRKFHDASDPYSFMVSHESLRVGVFTDLGRACGQLVHHFSLCHAAFLEANYDAVMLEKGNYPYHLKKRISGGSGHLSNHEALRLFTNHRAPHLSHLILSHLSKNNNDPRLVEELFEAHKGDTAVIIASRYKESAVYQITGDKSSALPLLAKQHTQLSLF